MNLENLLAQTGPFQSINWGFHFFFMMFFFVLGTVLWLRARKEDKRWQEVASRFNMIFSERAGDRMEPVVKRFALLGTGTISQATQILYGDYKGREMLAFNWFFKAGDQLNAVRGGFSCCVLTLREARPGLLLLPDELGVFNATSEDDRMVLGEDDLSSRYRLYCRDRAFADTFFTAERADILDNMYRPWLELRGNQLLLAYQGELDPQKLEADFDRILKFG